MSTKNNKRGNNKNKAGNTSNNNSTNNSSRAPLEPNKILRFTVYLNQQFLNALFNSELNIRKAAEKTLLTAGKIIKPKNQYIEQNRLTQILFIINRNEFLDDLILPGVCGRKGSGINQILICGVSQYIKNFQLIFLDLSDNPIQGYLDMLVEAILESKTLERLHLRNSSLTKDSFPSLIKLITESETLTQIDLGHADIPNKQFKKVLEALEENEKLQVVLLDNNNYSSAGTSIQGLKDNTTIVTLDLTNININLESVIKVLKNNKTLQVLGLTIDKIRQDTLTNFAKILKKNKTLNRLYLNFRGLLEIDASIARILGLIIFRCKCLQCFRFTAPMVKANLICNYLLQASKFNEQLDRAELFPILTKNSISFQSLLYSNLNPQNLFNGNNGATVKKLTQILCYKYKASLSPAYKLK